MRLLVAALALSVLLAAPAEAERLRIYSSLPLRGPQATETAGIVRGIQLALREAGGRAGPFDIDYVSLDDSTRAAGNWDPGQVARNARRAARDRGTIAFIGNFNSGASAFGLPILNQLNVPQISPSNTYLGLTRPAPGAVRGEPKKWYPTGKRTYVRVIPQDTVQAAALATEMQADGCQRVAVAHDGESYGRQIALNARVAAQRLGLGVAAFVEDVRRSDAGKVAARAERAGADCFLFAGVKATGGPQIYRAVAARLPAARLYGGDGVCYDTTWVRALAGRFECSLMPLPPEAYPGGAGFLSAYQAAFGRPVDAIYAIHGYEAMKLALDTIASLGDRGNRREAVRRALFAVRDRASVLGTYSIDRFGDTTLRSYGIYRAGSDGAVVYDHAVTGA